MALNYDVGNLGNYMIVPDYLRQQVITLIDGFDKEWTPWFSKMMPRQPGPGNGSKRNWTRLRHSDPQGMARFYGELEEIVPMNKTHVRPWSYNTRKIGNTFVRGKNEFTNDFKEGVIEMDHAKELENLTKFINRTIEYTLTRFAYGDANVMWHFTNQDLNRQSRANITAGTFRGVATAQLGGQRWNNFVPGTPPVFEDLAYLKKRFKRMAGAVAKYFMIGRETEYALELNDDLLDRLIRIKDTTQGILGEYLMGLNLIKVTGQTYKEIPNANAQQIGMPGMGYFIEQDWTRLNKHDMMVEQIGGNTFEWGVIGTDDVGSVKCGWVDDDHKAERTSPTNIFIEQFEQNRPKSVWTRAQLEMCPYINDYAKLMLVRGIAIQED